MAINGVDEKQVVQTASKKTVPHKTADIGNIEMTKPHAAKAADAKHNKGTSTVEQNFKKDLASGKLKQAEIKFNVLGFEVTKKLDSYLYTPAKGETYYDIKNHYKLADGTLKRQALAEGYSGDLDNCAPKGPVSIGGDELRASIEASKEHKANTQH